MNVNNATICAVVRVCNLVIAAMKEFAIVAKSCAAVSERAIVRIA